VRSRLGLRREPDQRDEPLLPQRHPAGIARDA
jgi:hypothetical protein